MRFFASLRMTNNCNNRLSKIAGIGGSTYLIENNLDGRFLGSQFQHRLDEILAIFAIQPSGTDDDVLATNPFDGLLTVKLG